MSYILTATKDGRMEFSSDYQKAQVKEWLTKHAGKPVKLTLHESPNQRRFFEGALIPIVIWCHGQNYKDWKTREAYRDVVCREFNGEIIPFGKSTRKIAKTTKGILNQGFIERIITWLETDFGIDRTLCLDSNDYKKYRDELRPFTNVPENYIDYLLKLNRLTKVL